MAHSVLTYCKYISIKKHIIQIPRALTRAAADVAEGRHEVLEAGGAAAEDARGRRGLAHDVIDRVGRAAELQPAVLGRPELLEGGAHAQDLLLQTIVSQGNCKENERGRVRSKVLFIAQ